MAYTVKAVADLAGISVRALHHYDHIGLLRPAQNSSGYRQYSDEDLERLQQILFFRELGFGLTEIAAILDRPGFDRREALVTHRLLLLEKQKRIQALIGSVDRTLEAMERGKPVEKKTMFEGFDDTRGEQYREEAIARYGKVAEESYERVGKYSKEQWNSVKAEMEELTQAIADRMEGDPGDEEVQRRVDQWFRLINDRFYDCSLEIFRGLGDLYVGDSRFTATYDKVRPGLAEFMRKAMHLYCDRREGKA